MKTPGRSRRGGSRSHPAPWILALLVMAVSRAAADPARSEAALGILRKADAALRQTRTLSYSFDYIGAGENLGRAGGTATMHREPSGRLLGYKGSVDMTGVFAGYEQHPKSYVVASGDGKAWRLDRERSLLETGSLSDGASFLVNRGAGFFLFPQLSRDDPFRVEIEQPERAELLGSALVGGVACDLVSLTFPPDSGMGSQFFYFGREDSLPRRIVFMAPAGQDGTIFAWDLTLTDLTAGSGPPPGGFEIPAGAAGRVIDHDQVPVAEGDPAPAWSLLLSDGAIVSSESEGGRLVILDFWASWCPFCHENLPLLDRLGRELEGSEGARIIAVNIWETGEAASAYFEERGFDLDLALGGEALAERFKVTGTPTAIVIGTDGRIMSRDHRSGEPRDSALRDVLKRPVAGAE